MSDWPPATTQMHVCICPNAHRTYYSIAFETAHVSSGFSFLLISVAPEESPAECRAMHDGLSSRMLWIATDVPCFCFCFCFRLCLFLCSCEPTLTPGSTTPNKDHLYKSYARTPAVQRYYIYALVVVSSARRIPKRERKLRHKPSRSEPCCSLV